MKKIISLLTAIIMIICLAGCTVTFYTSSNDTDTVSQSKIQIN